jgi:GntR family transcriptional regulator
VSPRRRGASDDPSSARAVVQSIDDPSRLPRVGGASLTQRVLDAMVHAIRTQSFDSGRLPPEDELAELLGVSRTTVRRALQSLEQIGLIERRPGRGTRVRGHAKPDLLALHGLVPFPTLLRELGHEVTTEVRWTRSEVADPDLKLRMRRPIPGASYERNVILKADGERAISMVERFPTDVLSKDLEDDDLSSGSILFLSERQFKEKIHHAIASIEPRVMADANGTAAAIGLKPGAPYLVLEETFYSAEETPLATSEVSVNPKYVTFSVFRRFL